MAMTKKKALEKWNRDNPSDAVAFSPGKGRLSREANALLERMAGEGWDIDGITVTKSDNNEPVIKREKANPQEIADLPPLRYDEKAFKAVSDIPSSLGMTEFGMREVCNTCHNSLTYHYCDYPVTHGVPVRIVPL